MILVATVRNLSGRSTLGSEILMQNAMGRMLKKTFLSHEDSIALLNVASNFNFNFKSKAQVKARNGQDPLGLFIAL